MSFPENSENTDIGLVQFAIRTDDIKKKEMEETAKGVGRL